jgi:hypothetical protein
MIAGNAIAISIISFALSISMAKLYAKKHKYRILANQVNQATTNVCLVQAVLSDVSLKRSF